jgi:3-oxoacyl-[acyl-carrier protein] reductase
MDLGISGRKAIVCASSRGLGRACALSLAREGCIVVVNGLDPTRLADTASEIGSLTGASIIPVRADVTAPEGLESLLAACPEPDILVNNNAGPPPGNLEDWGHTEWIAALEANLLASVFLIKAVLPGMRARRFGRIVNITSGIVKAPRNPFGLSVTVRAGLMALCKALSRDVVVDNVTINNLLPEGFDTDRQRALAQRRMQLEEISYEEAIARIAGDLAAKRLGRPEELGDACAYLCSTQAGFISGQNFVVDGGTSEAFM